MAGLILAGFILIYIIYLLSSVLMVKMPLKTLGSLLPKWVPSSAEALAKAEDEMLKDVVHHAKREYVEINNGRHRIYTVILNPHAQTTPLVLVHGLGAGVAFWALNFPELCKHRTVYAIDVLGFGRSSRPRFSKDPLLAEMELVESIEEWRRAVKLDTFILLGHSMGGFISASYALRYPDRLKHLILVDPWGFKEQPEKIEGPEIITANTMNLMSTLTPWNPFDGLRLVGPVGPFIIKFIQPFVVANIETVTSKEHVCAYIYHCNVRRPSGETAFKTMSLDYNFARFPMINRITELPKKLRMTFIYGSKSFIDYRTGYKVQELMKDSVDVKVFKNAGHNMFSETAPLFNVTVNNLCQQIDYENGLLEHVKNFTGEKIEDHENNAMASNGNAMASDGSDMACDGNDITSCDNAMASNAYVIIQ